MKAKVVYGSVVDAGIQRYKVGTDTPRFAATSRGGISLASNFLADSILLSVIWRLRPPLAAQLSSNLKPRASALGGELTFHFCEAGYDVKKEAA